MGLPIPAVGVFDAPTTCVTFNIFWLSYVIGALDKDLTREWVWDGTDEEKYLATQEVEKLLLAMIDGNCVESLGMQIGMMTPYVGTITPNSEWLICDGGEYAFEDYPVLAALLGYDPIEHENFNVPDMRGRGAIGAGTLGVHTYDLHEAVGEADVTLTEDQIATHSHGTTAHSHTTDPHTHVQDAHNHTQNSHNHTQDSHNHTQNSHNHTQDAHGHTQAGHNHTIAAGNAAGSTANTVSRSGITSGTVTVSTELPAINNATATNQAATATNQAATATNQATTATNQEATATNQNATVSVNEATVEVGDAGGGEAHTNIPPSYVVNWLIKAL